MLEDRQDIADLPLLVNDDLRPYQRDALEILGYSDDRLIKVPRDSLVACARLHVPTNLRGGVGLLKPGIEWLRHRLMVPGEAEARQDGGRRLYVSRADASRRRLLNEHELISALASYEFEVIVPGEMSFRDQIRIFSQASLVVGCHGAALTNLVFAPPGCGTVEIAPKPIAYIDDFRIIAECLGQRNEAIVTDDIKYYPTVRQPMSDYDFRVDVKDVVSAVSRILEHR